MKWILSVMCVLALPIYSVGTYRIQSKLNSKCVGTSGNKDWANVIITSCRNIASRKWEKKNNNLYTKLINEKSGKCMDLKNGSTKKGNTIIQYSCHAGPNMQWKYIPMFRRGAGMLKNKKSKLCLTIKKGSSVLVQKRCRGRKRQLWKLVKVKSSKKDDGHEKKDDQQQKEEEVLPPVPNNDDKVLPPTPSNDSTNFKGCATGKENVASLNLRMEKEVLRLTNIERRKVGAPPLKWDNNLARAARYHAADMATENYFSHDSQDRSGGRLKKSCATFKRIRAFSNKAGAENIAAGSSTAKAVINQWMNSSGHRKNMLSKSYKTLGVGYYKKSGSKWGNYWVQNFGW
ncbi:MAG: CAP domain-containing protein [Spirochaetota bacterium]